MKKTAGYCKLCRAKEIELYGTIVTDDRHEKVCKEAGCFHPAFYLPLQVDFLKSGQEPDVVHIGVAIDKEKEAITMASFTEGSSAEAFEEGQAAKPGLPIFVFRLFDKPENISKQLLAFMREFDIPEESHREIFEIMVEGLRRG